MTHTRNIVAAQPIDARQYRAPEWIVSPLGDASDPEDVTEIAYAIARHGIDLVPVQGWPPYTHIVDLGVLGSAPYLVQVADDLG